MPSKRFKVGDLIVGDNKSNKDLKGAIIDKDLTENHPKWKIRWENGTETLEATRGIKKRPRTYDEINLAIANEEAEELQTNLEALHSDNEDIDEVLEDSDYSILSNGSEFRFFVLLTATYSNINYSYY